MVDGVILWCDWNGDLVNKDRVNCVTKPSDYCMLTTRGGYGTSLDLVLWRVLAPSRRRLCVCVVLKKKLVVMCWVSGSGIRFRFSTPKGIVVVRELYPTVVVDFRLYNDSVSTYGFLSIRAARS